jgi:hypothetical protein
MVPTGRLDATKGGSFGDDGVGKGAGPSSLAELAELEIWHSISQLIELQCASDAIQGVGDRKQTMD